MENLDTTHEEEIELFRKGVKWGIELFSHPQEIDGKWVSVVGTEDRPTLLEKVLKQVDEGRWDDVMKK